MSRIGQKPVPVPSGVKVALAGRTITVEGALGKLTYEHRPEVKVTYDEAARQVVIERHDESRTSKSLHGLTRSLIANMVEGVTKGYQKSLEIVGVGYNARIQGRSLMLTVGYADVRSLDIPEGVSVEVPAASRIVVKGPDKQKVGDFAARVRRVREPEPYQGKGIRYSDEVVRRKAGKAFAGTGAT